MIIINLNKIQIVFKIIFIISILYLGFSTIILFKFELKVQDEASILLRQSIEEVCGESRIINSKIPNYNKGRFIGTYTTNYIDYDIVKPLNVEELNTVKNLYTDKCKKTFNSGEDITAKVFNTNVVDLINENNLLSSKIEFHSDLPLFGDLKLIQFVPELDL